MENFSVPGGKTDLTGKCEHSDFVPKNNTKIIFINSFIAIHSIGLFASRSNAIPRLRICKLMSQVAKLFSKLVEFG